MSESDPQPRVDREHPWPALLAFHEDDQSYFGGRDDEIDALYRRIAAGRITLLFGLSGLGKTSLLRAGLFPRLRREHYFPVYIRLSYGRGLPSPVEQIKAEIAAQAKASKVDAPEPRAGETLWEYFHRSDADFWDERNYPCTPVLVFDQFEELFTKGRDFPAAANEVVEELANLAEGASTELMREAASGDRALLRQVWEDRYRLLFGIRSDYLAQLQGISDRVRAIFANRYELHRMSGTAALRSTLTAGGHLMDEEVARRVVRFVAGAPESGDADLAVAVADLAVEALEVEPALLSLVCSELNATRLANGAAKITASMLSGSKDEILSRFYEATFADVAPELRELVEDKLVTRDGRSRNFISEQTARETPGVTEDDLGRLVHRRLLRFEESGSSRRLELTHDVLTTIAAASRATREQRRQLREAERARLEAEQRTAAARRAVRRSRAAALVFLVLLAAAIAGPFIASKRAAIGARRVEAEAAFRIALQKLATEEPGEGLAYLARVVRTDSHNDAARTLLYEQFLTRSWPVLVRSFGPSGRTIDAAAITGDGARVAFRTGRNIEVWDTASGKPIASLAAGFQPASIRFAGDGWTLILDTNDAQKESITYEQPLLWNCRTKRTLTLIDALSRAALPPEVIPSIDVSADGEKAIVASNSTAAVISLGQEMPAERTNLPESTLVNGVRFSPDARFAVIDGLHALTIWDRSNGGLRNRFPLGDFKMAFSRDGQKLLTVNAEGDVEAILLDGAKPFGKPLQHPSPAIAAAFDSTAERVVTVAKDYGVRIWDLQGGQALHDPLWHYEPVYEARFSDDGFRVITASTRLVRWWNANSGAPLGAPIERKTIAARAFGRGSDIITVSSTAGRVWTLPVAVLPPVLPGNGRDIAALSADRKVAVVDNAVQQRILGFDTESGKQLWSTAADTPPLPPDTAASAVDVAQQLIDVRTGRRLAGRPPPGGRGRIFSGDRSAVVYQMHDSMAEPSTVGVLSVAAGTLLGPPIEVKGFDLETRLSGDGSLLAVVAAGGEVQVWDVRQHKQVLTVRDDDGVRIDISRDGRRLVTASSQYGVRVWDVGSGKARALGVVPGEKFAVFAPDGKRLAVIAPSEVTICDAKSLKCLPDTLAHREVVEYDFSADGTRMMTATDDDVRVWDITTARALSLALPRRKLVGMTVGMTTREVRRAAGITSDGGAVVVLNDVLYRLPLPLEISDDDAERLADIADAVAGVRVVQLGTTERVDGGPELEKLARECSATRGLACDVVTWLKAPPDRRTISPASPIRVGDYVKSNERRDEMRTLFPYEP